MSESKIELTHRLVAEGRWQAACEFRDRVRKEQRVAGKKRAEANDEAWRLMAVEFPPLVPGSEPAHVRESASDIDDGDDSFELPFVLLPGTGDYEGDLRWAWQHIGDMEIKPTDAPNGCAWFLLQYGRADAEKFVPLVVKALGPKSLADRSNHADREFQFGLIANVAKEFADERCTHCGELLNASPSVTS